MSKLYDNEFLEILESEWACLTRF